MARQTVIRSDDRGKTDISWLHSRHTFSFGNYRNPERDQFKNIRVLNDDIVLGGGGFDTHPHKNMEIVTYVLSGALAHKDSLGSEQILHPGEIQRMSAGTGILHGEWNASKNDPVHFLQIWITPKQMGDSPRYEQAAIIDAGILSLMVSRDGREDTLSINQECDLFRLRLTPADMSFTHKLPKNEAAFIHVIDGTLEIALPNDSVVLSAGDAIAIEDPNEVSFNSKTAVHGLFFQLL